MRALGLCFLLCCLCPARGHAPHARSSPRTAARRPSGRGNSIPRPLAGSAPGGLGRRKRPRVSGEGMQGEELDMEEDFPEEFACAICHDLVFKPVVLPCGHLFCFWCCHRSMNVIGDRNSSCPLCRAHYSNFPRPCLVLQNFLERQAPEAFARRMRETGMLEAESGVTSAEAIERHTAKRATQDTEMDEVHAGIGCDECGQMPIRGKRFHCAQCVGPVGFDLCSKCHSAGIATREGRFDQAHEVTHEMREEPMDDVSLAASWYRKERKDNEGAGLRVA